MAKWTMQKRASQFTSSTRPSIKNSRKYRRTAGTDGASGEPRFTRRTAFLMLIPNPLLSLMLILNSI